MENAHHVTNIYTCQHEMSNTRVSRGYNNDNKRLGSHIILAWHCCGSSSHESEIFRDQNIERFSSYRYRCTMCSDITNNYISNKYNNILYIIYIYRYNNMMYTIYDNTQAQYAISIIT